MPRDATTTSTSKSSQAAQRPFKNDARALTTLADNLRMFVESFADLFKTKTDDGLPYARLYLHGLVTEAPRKNMERINEHLDADAYEGVQHFLSASPWDESKLYAAIAQRANGRLGGLPGSVLVIDESATSKKGDKSVGVARQHNGRLGKQDNCQVGVYSALNAGVHSALIGARLFLPKEWTNDPKRCAKAWVPEDQIQERSKLDLAWELIEQAVRQGVNFACVCFDCLYGRDSSLREKIHQAGLIYCAELPEDTRLFVSAPTMQKRPWNLKAHTRSAKELGAQMMAGKVKAQNIELREGENGMVRVQAWAQRVWVWPEDQASREQWLLMTRSEDGSLKFSLCNAPAQTSLKRMVQWQGARFHIERAFQDAKSHVGMSQYQVRGWQGWQHHMALVALGLLFITEQRMLQKGGALEMLSARDVVEMLDYCLTRQPTPAQLMKQLSNRHARRKEQAQAAQKRKRRKFGLPKQRKKQRNHLPK